MGCKLVAYYRVSTKKQGASGLGLEAQEAAVAAHVAATGCTLVASYTEVESGKNNARAALQQAIARAKRAKATLVIAKLDRLSRNVCFISTLMEAGVDFVACDDPTTSPFTIHIKAAVAELEARMISERTKVALAAAKARGRTNNGKPWAAIKALGAKNLTSAGTAKGLARSLEARSANKRAAYADLLPSLKAMRTEGLSLRAIASKLNEDGQTTRNAAVFTAATVQRILALEDLK